jgi:tetratricopeptide (TPR) repeat protein
LKKPSERAQRPPRAGLLEADRAIGVYEERLAASPEEPRAFRLLAYAYLAARRYDRAREVAETGLELVPDDPVLRATRGEAKAGSGDSAGALADWQRELELEPEDIGLQQRLSPRARATNRRGRRGLAGDRRLERGPGL